MLELIMRKVSGKNMYRDDATRKCNTMIRIAREDEGSFGQGENMINSEVVYVFFMCWRISVLVIRFDVRMRVI